MEYNWYVIRKTYDNRTEVILLDKEDAGKYGYEFDVAKTYDSFSPRKSIYSVEYKDYDLDVVGFSTAYYGLQFIHFNLFDYQEMKNIESLIDGKTYTIEKKNYDEEIIREMRRDEISQLYNDEPTKYDDPEFVDDGVRFNF